MKKLVTTISFLLALLSAPLSISAQEYQRVASFTNVQMILSVPAGKYWVIEEAFTDSPAKMDVTYPVLTIGQRFGIVKGQIILGPATIRLGTDGFSEQAFLVYREYDNVPSSSLLGPSNTVVIPSNAAGNVDIILETSTDLVNWSAALPGIYIPTGTGQFFRVKAVAQ